MPRYCLQTILCGNKAQGRKRGSGMIKKLATLTVRKSADYYNTVVKALKEAGFTIVQEYDGLTEDVYIIAESEDAE